MTRAALAADVLDRSRSEYHLEAALYWRVAANGRRSLIELPTPADYRRPSWLHAASMKQALLLKFAAKLARPGDEVEVSLATYYPGGNTPRQPQETEDIAHTRSLYLHRLTVDSADYVAAAAGIAVPAGETALDMLPRNAARIVAAIEGGAPELAHLRAICLQFDASNTGDAAHLKAYGKYRLLLLSPELQPAAVRGRWTEA